MALNVLLGLSSASSNFGDHSQHPPHPTSQQGCLQRFIFFPTYGLEMPPIGTEVRRKGQSVFVGTACGCDQLYLCLSCVEHSRGSITSLCIRLQTRKPLLSHIFSATNRKRPATAMDVWGCFPCCPLLFLCHIIFILLLQGTIKPMMTLCLEKEMIACCSLCGNNFPQLPLDHKSWVAVKMRRNPGGLPSTARQYGSCLGNQHNLCCQLPGVGGISYFSPHLDVLSGLGGGDCILLYRIFSVH